MRKYLYLCAALFASLIVFSGKAHAQNDIFIRVVNSTGTTVGITNVSSCLNTTCPGFIPSFSSGSSENFNAEYVGTGGVGGLIQFEVGTFNRRCQLSWAYNGSAGTITGVGSFTWMPSAGIPGSIPTCSSPGPVFNPATNELNVTITISGF